MKIKKNKFLFKMILCIISIAVFITGCSSVSGIDKIAITYVKAPLNVPSIIQKDKGLFQKEFEKDKIEVEFSTITSGPQQTQALAAGEIDFLNAVGGTSAILAAANGVDLKVISTYSRAAKAFMIITNSEQIKSPKDLKGKKIGGPKGTILHQLLMTSLDKNGLNSDDVEFISMDIPDALSALSNNQIDAALLAGPAALNAIKGGAKVVTTGENLIDGTIVVVASDKMIKEHPEIVAKFLKVQKDSIGYIENHLEESFNITSKETGLSKEDVKQMYNWYDFNPEIKDSDIDGLKKTQEFLLENGMLEKKIDIDNIIMK